MRHMSSKSLKEIQKTFLQNILSSEKSDQGISRYRGIVSENHRSALRDTYPVCEKIVGEDYFKVLAWNFLCTHPPKDPDMNFYGDTFSSFLEEYFNENSQYPQLAYLADIAALEWAMYYLQQVKSKEQIIINSQYNTLEIWRAHQGEDLKNVERIPLKRVDCSIAVQRKDDAIWAKEL